MGWASGVGLLTLCRRQPCRGAISQMECARHAAQLSPPAPFPPRQTNLAINTSGKCCIHYSLQNTVYRYPEPYYVLTAGPFGRDYSVDLSLCHWSKNLSFGILCFGVREVHRVGSTVTPSAVFPSLADPSGCLKCPGPTLPLKPGAGRGGRCQERFWTRRAIGQPQHLQHPEPGLTCSGGQAGRARPAVFPFPGPRFCGLRFFLPSNPSSVRSTKSA